MLLNVDLWPALVGLFVCWVGGVFSSWREMYQQRDLFQPPRNVFSFLSVTFEYGLWRDVKNLLMRITVVQYSIARNARKPPKKPPLPVVPREAVDTEKSFQTVNVSQAEGKKAASAGKAQIEGTRRDPNLADWAPVPCPSV